MQPHCVDPLAQHSSHNLKRAHVVNTCMVTIYDRFSGSKGAKVELSLRIRLAKFNISEDMRPKKLAKISHTLSEAAKLWGNRPSLSNGLLNDRTGCRLPLLLGH